MRKLLVGLLCAGALSVAVPAQASVLGSFVSSEIKPGQPHRVYVTVTAGKGSKTCDVTLHARTIPVDLGTDKEGSAVFLFLRVKGAKIALAQAQAAPSPTPRIVCSH